MTKADARELAQVVARSNARYDRYLDAATSRGASEIELADLRAEKGRAVRQLVSAYPA